VSYTHPEDATSMYIVGTASTYDMTKLRHVRCSLAKFEDNNLANRNYSTDL
jgi:hypothetical protein